MIEFLSQYHIEGIAIGALTFLIIGIFHPLVIKAEYYLGVKSWWLFLIAGIIFMIFSIMVTSLFISIILAVLAFSSFWSIIEIFEQRQRVLKGWFPKNPKREYDYENKVKKN